MRLDISYGAIISINFLLIRGEKGAMKLLTKLVVSFALFAAFSVSGHLAMFLESYHNSMLASLCVFNASFTGILYTGFKIWPDIFT